jgi:hypothetical protein
MVTIILESHATSVDNEAGVASGHGSTYVLTEEAV